MVIRRNKVCKHHINMVTWFMCSYYILRYLLEWLQKGRIVWYCLSVQIFNLPAAAVPRPSNLKDPFLFHQKAKLWTNLTRLLLMLYQVLFWYQKKNSRLNRTRSRVGWSVLLQPNGPQYWQSPIKNKILKKQKHNLKVKGDNKTWEMKVNTESGS